MIPSAETRTPPEEPAPVKAPKRAGESDSQVEPSKKARVKVEPKMTPLQYLNKVRRGLSFVVENKGKAHKPNFAVTVEVDGAVYSGAGRSKQLAKQQAAIEALKVILDSTDVLLPLDALTSEVDASTKSKKASESKETTGTGATKPVTKGKTAVQLLHEVDSAATYECTEDASNPPRRFVMSVKVKGATHVGHGASKKLAKQAAARAALSAMGTVLEDHLSKGKSTGGSKKHSWRHQRMADRIGGAVMNKYDSIMHKRGDKRPWKVLSGMGMHSFQREPNGRGPYPGHFYAARQHQQRYQQQQQLHQQVLHKSAFPPNNFPRVSSRGSLLPPSQGPKRFGPQDRPRAPWRTNSFTGSAGDNRMNPQRPGPFFSQSNSQSSSSSHQWPRDWSQQQQQQQEQSGDWPAPKSWSTQGNDNANANWSVSSQSRNSNEWPPAKQSQADQFGGCWGNSQWGAESESGSWSNNADYFQQGYNYSSFNNTQNNSSNGPLTGAASVNANSASSSFEAPNTSRLNNLSASGDAPRFPPPWPRL